MANHRSGLVGGKPELEGKQLFAEYLAEHIEFEVAGENWPLGRVYFTADDPCAGGGHVDLCFQGNRAFNRRGADLFTRAIHCTSPAAIDQDELTRGAESEGCHNTITDLGFVKFREQEYRPVVEVFAV